MLLDSGDFCLITSYLVKITTVANSTRKGVYILRLFSECTSFT